jgi:putative membrane protein
MKAMHASAVVLAAALGAAACSRSDDGAIEAKTVVAAPEQESAETPLTASSTADFVEKVAMANLLEIETSKIAAQKTSKDNVRQFAQTTMTESEAAKGDLDRLSAQSEPPLTAPIAPDETASAVIQELNEASADELDARYLDAVVSAHQRAVDELERYAQSGVDAGLRAWATQKLPRLRARLQEADTLRQSVNIAPS